MDAGKQSHQFLPSTGSGCGAGQGCCASLLVFLQVCTGQVTRRPRSERVWGTCCKMISEPNCKVVCPPLHGGTPPVGSGHPIYPAQNCCIVAPDPVPALIYPCAGQAVLAAYSRPNAMKHQLTSIGNFVSCVTPQQKDNASRLACVSGLDDHLVSPQSFKQPRNFVGCLLFTSTTIHRDFCDPIRTIIQFLSNILEQCVIHVAVYGEGMAVSPG